MHFNTGTFSMDSYIIVMSDKLQHVWLQAGGSVVRMRMRIWVGVMSHDVMIKIRMRRLKECGTWTEVNRVTI